MLQVRFEHVFICKNDLTAEIVILIDVCESAGFLISMINLNEWSHKYASGLIDPVWQRRVNLIFWWGKS